MPRKTSPKIARKTSPPEAIPAIVLKDSPASMTTLVHQFDSALRQMVREMNCRMQLECVSVQREKALQWTVMGTVCREFVVLTLDKSLTSFNVLLLLPFEFELKWFFSQGDIKDDIECALRAVYV
jgi:hypothetical protein